MKSKIIISILVFGGLFFLAGCNNFKQVNQSDQNKNFKIDMVNPASKNCSEVGGILKIVQRVVNGKNKGEYGICYFEDNRQCEEWSLFKGYCPKGGVKLTGYDTVEQRYCAILGAEVDMKNNLCKFSNGAECDLDDLYTNQCDQIFNNSATDWQYKKYDQAGVSIGYLANDVKLNNDSREITKDLTLTIKVDKIDKLGEATLGYDKVTSEKDLVSLSKGEFGENLDFALKSSEKLVKLSDKKTYAKEFAVLSRFDVCDVTFEKIAVFYHNGYRIILNLQGDSNKIITNNPTYFSEDKENCDENKVWKLSDKNIQDKFYQEINSGELSKSVANNWSYIFDQIIKAISLEKNNK